MIFEKYSFISSRFANEANLLQTLTGISSVQTSPPSLQFNCMATLVATDIIICFLDNVLDTITWLGTGIKGMFIKYVANKYL